MNRDNINATHETSDSQIKKITAMTETTYLIRPKQFNPGIRLCYTSKTTQGQSGYSLFYDLKIMPIYSWLKSLSFLQMNGT